MIDGDNDKHSSSCFMFVCLRFLRLMLLRRLYFGKVDGLFDLLFVFIAGEIFAALSSLLL